MTPQDPFDSDMEKRLLLAMALSMAVLFLVPYLLQKPVPPPAPPSEAPPTVEAAPRPLPRPLGLKTEPSRAIPRQIELENAVLRLRWNTEGGVLESARLKAYRSREAEAVELIPQQIPGSLNQALAVRVGEEELDRRLAGAVYEVERQPPAGDGPRELHFFYRDEMVEVSRRLRLPPDGYMLELETSILVNGRPRPHLVVLGPGIGTANPGQSTDFANPQIAFYQAGSVTRYAPDDLEAEPLQLEGPARWVALDCQYFTYLILDENRLGALTIDQVEFQPDPETNSQPLMRVSARVEAGAPVRIYMGPKDYEILQQAEESLSQLIDYGWFAFLVQPLLLSLRFIYHYVHNYGWAIIILTFIINLALFPVRYKQMASMKKMSELQPQMKAIQAKYKKMKRDDPRRQKQNEEVMALYREHGVNPLGGCLPLLIQMPFLFAFYRMLYSSIELRGAPFIAWIQDLSRPDPHYVTPIIMGVTMVIQQRMTPATGDPTQRRMMMFLPIVFTFFFLNFSSGLVLYFLFSNVFGMIFQFLMQRWTPELAQPSPKKKAAGKK